MSRYSDDPRRVRRPRGMRITAVATVLALAGTVAEVPLGTFTPVAHAQFAPQPQDGIIHGEVRIERDWRGAIFFSKPMRVNTVALEFVPAETTPPAVFKKIEPAPLGDPVFDKIPETSQFTLEHRVFQNGRAQVIKTYDVTVHRSVSVTPSGNYAIRLRYNLPDVQVDMNHQLILWARGKGGAYPTPMAGGGSRFTMPFVNLSATGKVRVHNPDEEPVGRPKVLVNSKSLKGEDLQGEEAVADDGSYWLSSNNPGATYQIEVQPPQGFVRPATKPWKDEATAPDFDLYPITVTGRVIDDKGVGISGARVTVGGKSAQTDQSGNFTVPKVPVPKDPEDKYTLVVGETEDSQGTEVEGVKVEDQRVNRIADPIVVQRKQQYGKVSGKVNGLPERTKVKVRVVGTNTVVDTDENAEFTIPNLAVGKHVLEVVPESLPKGYSVTQTADVDVKRATTANANFTATRDKGSISGVIFGVPTDKQVKIRVTGPEILEQTVSGGHYSFPDLPTGDYRVEVIKDSVPRGYSVTGPQNAKVEKYENRTVGFAVIADNVTGVIKVVDDANRPVPNASVTVDGRTETTNAEGLATFGDLAPGAYTAAVSAARGKYSGASQGFVLYPGDNDPVTVKVGSLNQTGGIVVDDLGQAVAGAQVVVKQGSRVIGTFRTTPEGNFNAGALAAGNYTAEVARNNTYQAASANFTVEPGGDTESVMLKVALHRGSIKVGTSGPLAPTGVFLNGGPNNEYLPIEEAGGDYVLNDLYPGEYTLGGRAPEGYTIEGGGAVTINPNETSEKTLNVVRNLGNIAGSVTGLPSGQPAEIQVRGADQNTAGVKKTAPVVNGTYSIAGLPTGTYTVEIVGPQGYSAPSQVAKVKKDSTETHDFALALDKVDLVLQVVDDTGHPVANAKLDVAGRTVNTNAEGMATVEDILPGTYTAKAAESETHSEGSREITLQPGRHGSGEILVKTLNAVSGTLLDDLSAPVANAPILITQNGKENAKDTTDAHGRFNAGKLHAGEYTVQVESSDNHGGTTQRFSVEPNKPRDLELTVALVKGSVNISVTGDAEPESITITGGPKNETRKVEKVDGKYVIDGLYPGDYTVTAKAPSNHAVTRENDGKVTVKPTEQSNLGITVKKEPATSNPAPQPDPFVWAPVVVHAGEVGIGTPTRKGSSDPVPSGFTTNGVEKVISGNKTEQVAPKDSWIRVEQDGTVVATPPRDAAPGTYRVEVNTPTGQREVVEVVVAEEKPMADRYTVEWAKTPVPAGVERSSSSPRAQVVERGFTYDDRVLPAGTTFTTDAKGVTIDAKGSITFKPEANAKRGSHTVPVTITFPDGSPKTVNAVFEVGEPMLADLANLGYEDEIMVVPGLSATVLRTGDAALPEGTTFKMKSGSSLGGWSATVDANTGDVRVNAPKVNARPLTVKVIAYFQDGSTKELEARARLATASAHAVKNSISYPSTTVRVGNTVAVAAVGDAVKGAVFDVIDNAGLDVGVNRSNGALRITAPKNAEIDETYKPLIQVRYPDGSAREITATVTVPSDAATFDAGYVGANVPIGGEARPEPSSKLPEGTRFSIDGFNEQGWTATIDEKTGRITARSNGSVPNGKTTSVKVRVTYPDGSSELVNVPLTARAPEKVVVEDKGSSTSVGWIAVLVGALALLAGVGFAAFLNQDKIMQVLGR
ncbi:carboxypeptidase regulatory-like domain-containing protein [Corynebacterium coyleae]|uniref:carboxypeptidase regulatory-like domain-containing protein n=1 Tax=Corynebacterium coyleae TaxID=53374 RepID=UPI0015E0EF88|nr:carboxypeptidase regulatory-like domain-containing protein [Corynebacterium coyleae]